MTIEEFAVIINADIIVQYHSEFIKLKEPKGRWMAQFRTPFPEDGICEVKTHKSSGILCRESGWGHTPDLAIAKYIENIKGKTLVFNAMSAKRREYGVPETLKS